MLSWRQLTRLSSENRYRACWQLKKQVPNKKAFRSRINALWLAQSGAISADLRLSALQGTGKGDYQNGAIDATGPPLKGAPAVEFGVLLQGLSVNRVVLASQAIYIYSLLRRNKSKGNYINIFQF